MWMAIIIGLVISLCGAAGMYVNEYWDSFRYKGKRRGVYQFAAYVTYTTPVSHRWPTQDLDSGVGILTAAQKGL